MSSEEGKKGIRRSYLGRERSRHKENAIAAVPVVVVLYLTTWIATHENRVKRLHYKTYNVLLHHILVGEGLKLRIVLSISVLIQY